MTDRVRAEEELRRSESRYRELFNSVQDVVFSIAPDERIESVNPAFFEATGWAAEEVIGRPAGELVHPEDVKRVAALLQQSVQGHTRLVEVRLAARDGRYLTFEMGFARRDPEEAGGLSGVARNITERKESEVRLRLHQQAIEALSSGIIIAEQQETAALISYVNPAFTRITGFTRDEVLNTDWHFLRRLSADPAALERVLNAVHEDTGGEWTLACRRGTGEPFWIELRLSPVRSANGRLTHMIAVLSDATARVKDAASMAGARDAALQLAKTKSEFLSTMSHELRTPLNGMLGMVRLLLQTALTPEQRDYVETLHDSGQTLLSLVNDILDHSRIEAGTLLLEEHPFDLGGVVADIVRLLTPQAVERGLELVVDYPPGVPRRFVGDALRVRQMLLNLAGNALKFTHEGQVTIRAEQRGRRAGSGIRLNVSDTGIGIPVDKIEAVFQKFTQADASTTREYGGTGLGLSITRQLVQAMGGEVGVCSTPGEGSTFWLDLSLPEPEEHSLVEFSRPPAGTANSSAFAPAPAAALEPGAPRPALTGNILLVDDNATNRKVMGKLLGKAGYRVQTAGSGREAIELCSRRSFDLVLMDWQMPEMDGLDTTRSIRRNEGAGPRIPIVAVTANSLPGDREACLAAGMNDYLAKPVNLDQLATVLRRWISAGGCAGISPEQDDCLRRLADAVGEDFVEELFDDLAAGGAEHLAAIRAGLARVDADTVSRAAHTLKSMCLTLGFAELGSACESLEALARTGILEGAEVLVQGIATNLQGVSACKEWWLAGKTLEATH